MVIGNITEHQLCVRCMLDITFLHIILCTYGIYIFKHIILTQSKNSCYFHILHMWKRRFIQKKKYCVNTI